MKDILKVQPYAEDDTLLNEWIDDIAAQINWNMFKNQEDWVYMSGDLGEGRFPQFKNCDCVYDSFSESFNRAIGILEGYLWERFITNIRLSNVDLGKDMENELRFLWGDERFEEWEAAAKEYVFEDYSKDLGEETANKIFNKAWGKNWQCKKTALDEHGYIIRINDCVYDGEKIYQVKDILDNNYVLCDGEEELNANGVISVTAANLQELVQFFFECYDEDDYDRFLDFLLKVKKIKG